MDWPRTTEEEAVFVKKGWFKAVEIEEQMNVEEFHQEATDSSCKITCKTVGEEENGYWGEVTFHHNKPDTVRWFFENRYSLLRKCPRCGDIASPSGREWDYWCVHTVDDHYREWQGFYCHLCWNRMQSIKDFEVAIDDNERLCNKLRQKDTRLTDEIELLLSRVTTMNTDTPEGLRNFLACQIQKTIDGKISRSTAISISDLAREINKSFITDLHRRVESEQVHSYEE